MKSVDKYVYPDTNILINKFDCRDEDTLREIEALSTGGNLAYLQLHPIKGIPLKKCLQQRVDAYNKMQEIRRNVEQSFVE